MRSNSTSTVSRTISSTTTSRRVTLTSSPKVHSRGSRMQDTHHTPCAMRIHCTFSSCLFAPWRHPVLEARLGKVEEVLRRWDDSWKRIEEASELIHRNTRRLNECMDALALKVDIADFAQMKAEVAAEMDRQYTEMNVTKASSQSLNSLEDSQHRILEEVVALQQLIACKV
jgi:hypothetical protein